MLSLHMARPIYLWIPSLTVLALSACGGASDGLFSTVFSAGAGGSNQAGSTSSAGSISSSGSTSSAGNPSTAGQAQAGGSAGAQTGGSGGVPAGGANSGGLSGATSSGGAPGGGGSAGRGAGGSGAAAGYAGEKGSAGTGGASQNLSCSELIKLAGQQLDAARACNLNADALQCTDKVTNLCDCQVPVQRSDSPETKAYLKTQKLLDDKDCIVACAAILCSSVNGAQCRASASTTMGTCVATNHGPGPD
jgi:hypothetical protein